MHRYRQELKGIPIKQGATLASVIGREQIEVLNSGSLKQLASGAV